MRKFMPFLCCVLAPIAIVVAGCPHGSFRWPDVVSCGSSVGDLVGTVTQILVADLGQGDDGKGVISADGQQKLTQLAEQYGASAVICIVSALIKDWSAPGAAANEQRFRALGRARDFLAKTGTRVEGEAGQ